jgi:iron complex outermembrane receptor protein
LARNIRQRITVSGSLYNLFDKRFANAGGAEHVQTSIPQDGRSFRVKLSYQIHAAR